MGPGTALQMVPTCPPAPLSYHLQLYQGERRKKGNRESFIPTHLQMFTWLFRQVQVGDAAVWSTRRWQDPWERLPSWGGS